RLLDNAIRGRNRTNGSPKRICHAHAKRTRSTTLTHVRGRIAIYYFCRFGRRFTSLAHHDLGSTVLDRCKICRTLRATPHIGCRCGCVARDQQTSIEIDRFWCQGWCTSQRVLQNFCALLRARHLPGSTSLVRDLLHRLLHLRQAKWSIHTL